MTADDPRPLLTRLYRHAVAAVDPGPAVRATLARLAPAPAAPIWLVALGKAAHPMARAAVEHLQTAGVAPAGGLVVAPDVQPTPHPALRVVAGDHPEPGAGSFAAAEALAATAAAVPPEAEAWVLLSGGTTALVGAPLAGIAREDLRALYARLLGSGLDITAMNRIRKRFARWAGGRLATALAAHRIRVLVVSDVLGDDLPSIGSGPCVPDVTTAADLRRILEDGGHWPHLAAPLRDHLDAVIAGRLPETPKPDHPAFARVETTLVASNALAVAAAAALAAELGCAVWTPPAPLEGEASGMGRAIIESVRKYLFSHDHGRGLVAVWGGETTVTLGDAPGLGGRSQELALAAARALDGDPRITLLAAGTDGRDGPTDAAGAIVDGGTWAAIAAAGRDPARDLAGHDAYVALDAAGALLRTGLSGTNVMDLVIAHVAVR